jgi:RimJ/RimL family protein N-acetyltransferase
MRIETPRLVLRRWVESDVDALAGIHSAPGVAAWLGPLTRDDTAVTVERYEHHWDVFGYGRFAVADRTTGALVGRVGIMHQPEWTQTPQKDEVGWVIATDRWGEGLATEAAAASIADTFERVGLERVLSWTLPDNLASVRVIEKCGMRRGGSAAWRGREHVWYDVCRGATGH